MAPDRTVPGTIFFGQRISGLTADGKGLHAPVPSENTVATLVTRRVMTDERLMLAKLLFVVGLVLVP